MEITLPKSGTVIELDDDMYGDYTDEQIYQLVYDGIKDEDDLKEDAEFIASYLPKESPEDLYVGQMVGGTTGSLTGAAIGATYGATFGPPGIAVGALLGGLGGGALGGGLGEYAEQEITGKEGNIPGAIAEEALWGSVPGGAGVPLRAIPTAGRVAASFIPDFLHSRGLTNIVNKVSRSLSDLDLADAKKALKFADDNFISTAIAKSGKKAHPDWISQVKNSSHNERVSQLSKELGLSKKEVQDIYADIVNTKANELAARSARTRSILGSGAITAERDEFTLPGSTGRGLL